MSASDDHLDQLLEFPCEFTFRVVAKHRDDLSEWCQHKVEQALGRPVDRVQLQPSRAGAYSAVRVVATVHEPAEVRRAYGALGALEGLKMLL